LGLWISKMWITPPPPMIGHVTRRMRIDRSRWW